MASAILSTGVDTLDGTLGGLLAGDNVVWIATAAGYDLFERRFLVSARAASRAVAPVVVDGAPPKSRPTPAGTVWVNARPGRPLASPEALEDELVGFARQHQGACITVGGFDSLAARWGRSRAVAFYLRCCPRLFELGAVAYWRMSSAAVGSAGLERVRQVAQCVLELGPRRLRIVKAEGRPTVVAGSLFEWSPDDAMPTLTPEPTLGRLGRGLDRIRSERNLTQADLARLAGVTPSAISQAETGHRGLSLDTLLRLSEQLGTTIDDLLDPTAVAGHQLARRPPVPREVTALFDDPGRGLRTYLIRLGPGQRARPPFVHKGLELVAMVAGLVQLEVGRDTPVMRAGDAALATRDSVTAWRNLLSDPALLFWIVGTDVQVD